MRHLCFCGIILFALCISCSKEKSQASQPASSVDYGLIKDVEQLNGQTVAIKLAVRMLNPQEKAVLWQRQLGFYLEADLNKDQKTYLTQVRNFITAQLFEDNSNLSSTYQSLEQLEEKGRQLFELPLLSNIVTNIHTEQFCIESVKKGHLNVPASNVTSSASSKAVVTPDLDNPPSCTCSGADDWCGSSTFCQWTSPATCKTSTLGCGLFGMFSCDGTCVICMCN